MSVALFKIEEVICVNNNETYAFLLPIFHLIQIPSTLDQIVFFQVVPKNILIMKNRTADTNTAAPKFRKLVIKSLQQD